MAAPPPRQYLLGSERQLTLDGRAEPLHVGAVPPPASSPAAGDKRQLQLPGPDGRSRQLALALFPEERRNPQAGVVLDDLEAVVQDWPAFWAPLEAELEEFRAAGGYKYVESVKLLAIGRWIHGLRHDAIERDQVTPPQDPEDAGCPLQIPARGLADVLCCKGTTRAARVTRAFRVLQELRERGEILRHPRLVTFRWATRHRAPPKQLLEVADLTADGVEIARRRVDVHGVIYFRWKGIGFIQRRGDRYVYVTRARARSETRVKVIAGPNFVVLTQFGRQLRRVAARLRSVQPRIPTTTSLPASSFSSSRTGGGAAARRPPQPGEAGGARARVAAPSPGAPSQTPLVENSTARPPNAQGSHSENKGPPPGGQRASREGEITPSGRGRALPTRAEQELEAEKRAIRAGWALPELHAEVDRCWRTVEWVPWLDVKGRPVYLGDGTVRVRPDSRPITTPERWRPGAWAIASPAGRDHLHRLFGPVLALLTVRIRWGEPPPSWTPPAPRPRDRFDTGVHAFGRGRCKQCGRQGVALMYEGRMSLSACEHCWDGGRPPRPATPEPPAELRERAGRLGDAIRRAVPQLARKKR